MLYGSFARQSLSNSHSSSLMIGGHRCRLLLEGHYFSKPLHSLSQNYYVAASASKSHRREAWDMSIERRQLPKQSLCNLGRGCTTVNSSLSFSTDAGGVMKTNTGTSQDQTPISNRAAFQALPVVPSLLAYIEKIGVGIRSKPSLSRKRRVGINSRRNNRREDASSAETLNEAEEIEFFTTRERDHSVRWRNQRGKDANATKMDRKGPTSLSNRHTKSEKKEKKSQEEPVGSYWLPPPPFSSFSKSDSGGRISNQTDGAQTQHSGRKIIRRPVKCLGRAGSLRDTLPLESIGLSEVAICGRSNVGKSTLLNALLYGNTDESLNPRKFQRGRTPQGAKLPKGVKAITSHKPGETKELSFYQLTADVILQTADDANNENGGKKSKAPVSKMSLLLVDLPGYGFAFAKEERTKEWQDLMHHYLLERRSLKRILLLLDARHGFKQTDFEFLSNLQDGLVQKNVEGKVRCLLLPHCKRHFLCN
ncbi:hypothetical protein ACHAWX_004357 [Stephanocyclus meneghinianus]